VFVRSQYWFLYFCRMIIIDNTIVSRDFLAARFICDLPRCKGECCVGGDAGAPLEEIEISFLEDNLDGIKPFMRPEGLRVVEREGVFDYDESGMLVTPLVDGGECAFVGYLENGTAICTIEQAYNAGKSDFKKPISCHLYPVRLVEKAGLVHVNYHQWSICVPAKRKGEKEGLPLYKFLKESLIRKFGEEWYQRLENKAKANGY